MKNNELSLDTKQLEFGIKIIIIIGPFPIDNIT